MSPLNSDSETIRAESGKTYVFFTILALSSCVISHQLCLLLSNHSHGNGNFAQLHTNNLMLINFNFTLHLFIVMACFLVCVFPEKRQTSQQIILDPLAGVVFVATVLTCCLIILYFFVFLCLYELGLWNEQ